MQQNLRRLISTEAQLRVAKQFVDRRGFALQKKTQIIFKLFFIYILNVYVYHLQSIFVQNNIGLPVGVQLAPLLDQTGAVEFAGFVHGRPEFVG